MNEVFPALVGRERHCQAITRALTRKDPHSIVIAGPPGVGRTRLAREAMVVAESAGRLTR
jgi:replication-associated recombination protein RarA